MKGENREVGAVIGVQTVRNPIILARAVMERSPHVTLATDGAERFADSLGDLIERVPNSFFSTPSRVKALEMAQEKEKLLQVHELQKQKEPEDQKTEIPPTVILENIERTYDVKVVQNDRLIDAQTHQETTEVTVVEDEELLLKTCEIETKKCFGTVGAVALDSFGHLAAATSTGGMTNKKFGRVGDSPLTGCGNWADERVAVSCTGWGEFFIRNAVAHDISCRVKYGNATLEDAANTVIHQVLSAHGGDGGVICVDSDGHVAMPFNSGCMFRGWVLADGTRGVAIYDEELVLTEEEKTKQSD